MVIVGTVQPGNWPFNPALAILKELEFIGSPVCNFFWSFGDGATSIAQYPAHTYATNGNFTVTLIATDGETFATNSFTLNASLAAPAVAQWVAGSASMVAKKFHISAAGSDGASYIIEATTNLKTWTPLITNTPTGGLLLFTDTASTNLLYRFYRIRTPGKNSGTGLWPVSFSMNPQA